MNYEMVYVNLSDYLLETIAKRIVPARLALRSPTQMVFKIQLVFYTVISYVNSFPAPKSGENSVS